MKKVWLIFKHEYLRHVLRKRFLFGLLSFPLIGILVIGVIALEIAVQMDNTPIGYVNDPQIFTQLQPLPEEDNSIFSSSPVITFATEDEARTALDTGEIQAYFVLDPGYLDNGQARMVAQEAVADNVEGDFGDVLRYNLTLTQPPEVINRLSEGDTVISRSLDGTREADTNNFLILLVPLLVGLIFIVAINTSGSYLLQAVVEEKENRTMEIIVTSVSPGQLMAAKTIGNLSVGLTQLIVWVLFALLTVFFTRNLLPIGLSFDLDPAFIILLVLTLLPAFIMIGGLMAAIGAMASESREAQQIAGLFTLPIMIPYWFISAIMLNPNGGLSVALSMIPFTAPVALPLRAAFTTIPIWQIGLAIGLLVLCAIGSLWLAGRLFRIGMLRYGKRLRWNEIFTRNKNVQQANIQ
ncbi:MAG TPA: ABC transporter permease [Longilinea sp.]|nr:ABC transporter permease [Longilinea sp.]